MHMYIYIHINYNTKITTAIYESFQKSIWKQVISYFLVTY